MQMTPACMAALSFAALLLLMQIHQLATQKVCGWNLIACAVGAALQVKVLSNAPLCTVLAAE